MNILIAIPTMETVPAIFCQCLAMLQKEGNCSIAMQTGSLVYDARNNLSKQALKKGADYVFWLDSDMVFEPTVLKDMLKTMKDYNFDILSGVYYRRKSPYTPVLFDKLEIFESGGANTTEFKQIPKEIFEVGGCGFGCVLMNAQVLLDVVARYREPFSCIGGIGEDLSFCWRARKCGHKIFADPSINLGHVGQTIINKSVYEAMKES